MTLEPESDLSWTAFLYISGELSPEESSAFERRLDEDQDAREAVASAVEMAGAVAVIGRDLPVKQTVRRLRIWAIALASAACLALAVVPWLRLSRAPSTDAAEVAEAWSGLRATSRVESDAEWVARLAESPSAETAEGIEAEDDPAERALPSWLLSATAPPSRRDPARGELTRANRPGDFLGLPDRPDGRPRRRRPGQERPPVDAQGPGCGRPQVERGPDPGPGQPGQ